MIHSGCGRCFVSFDSPAIGSKRLRHGRNRADTSIFDGYSSSNALHRIDDSHRHVTISWLVMRAGFIAEYTLTSQYTGVEIGRHLGMISTVEYEENCQYTMGQRTLWNPLTHSHLQQYNWNQYGCGCTGCDHGMGRNTTRLIGDSKYLWATMNGRNALSGMSDLIPRWEKE